MGEETEKEAWPKLFCLQAAYLKDVSSCSIHAILSIKSLRLLDMRGQDQLIDSDICNKAKMRDITCLFHHKDVYQDDAAHFGHYWPPSMLAFRPNFNFVTGHEDNIKSC